MRNGEGQPSQMLKRFKRQIDNITPFSKGGKIALHKPILLLLILADLINGKGVNAFLFDDYEDRIEVLLRKFGWMSTRIYHPQYPFWFMKSSDFWDLTGASVRDPDSPTRKELRGSTGALGDGFFEALSSDPVATGEILQYVLSKFWSTAIHEDILAEFGLQTATSSALPKASPKGRSFGFAQTVIRIYQRKCAICGYSCRLGDDLLGVDACHVWPRQYDGPDEPQNGLALCKMHHWAFDRGAISLSDDYCVLVAQDLTGPLAEDVFARFCRKRIARPIGHQNTLSGKYIMRHRNTIFRRPAR